MSVTLQAPSCHCYLQATLLFIRNLSRCTHAVQACEPPGGHASLHDSAQPKTACRARGLQGHHPQVLILPPTTPASAVWAVQAGGLPVSQGALHARVPLSSCLGTNLLCSAGWGRAWRPWLVACPSTLRRTRSRCCARWPGAYPWAPQMRHGGRTALDGPTSLARSSASRWTSGVTAAPTGRSRGSLSFVAGLLPIPWLSLSLEALGLLELTHSLI